ncbi:MAG: chemotaxis protein CheW [Polyangia bacterium]|jgi:chemotaxis signal transduction protein
MSAAAPLDVVFFALRGLRCALPLGVVRKVLPMRGITPVPLAPLVMRGVALVQGLILPVLDLAVCFQPGGGEDGGESIGSRLTRDKLLLVETAPEAACGAVRVAIVVERGLALGRVDEQYSRPPPARPSFLSATVVDAGGPALLLDLERSLDYVRDAISTVMPS